jgi:hypothetical protein
MPNQYVRIEFLDIRFFFSDNGYRYEYYVRISDSNTIYLISVGYIFSDIRISYQIVVYILLFFFAERN